MEDSNQTGSNTLIGYDPAFSEDKLIVALIEDGLLSFNPDSEHRHDLTEYIEHVTAMMRKATMPLQAFSSVIQGPRQRAGDNKPQQIPKSPTGRLNPSAPEMQELPREPSSFSYMLSLLTEQWR